MRTVVVALTEEEARHTEAWLRASANGMDESLREVWKTLPPGRTADKLAAALASRDSQQTKETP